MSGGGGNPNDFYKYYFVIEADLGMNSTDQVGFILIDSNSCLGDKRFRLKTIGQSKDSFSQSKVDLRTSGRDDH